LGLLVPEEPEIKPNPLELLKNLTVPLDFN
jgi:hypothetical protein